MRANSELEKRILNIVEPEADAMGLSVVRIRVMGGKTQTLQIMAERKSDGAMGVEDCAAFSRALSPVLDVEDPMPHEYNLEVSSPGIDRPLTRDGDFANWVGHEVKIELNIPIEGRKRFHGMITDEKNGAAFLTLKDGAQAEIPLKEMQKAHLVLTDDLIKEAASRGQTTDYDEDVFDDVEDEDGEDDGDIANADTNENEDAS